MYVLVVANNITLYRLTQAMSKAQKGSEIIHVTYLDRC